MADCSSIQKSLAWCQGRPELPGVKRRIYYISKYDIVKWPTLQHDANGRLTSASYSGDFTLLADSKWKYIDIIADKSQLTSEAQGEYPSQTQLNKLVAVHPGVEAEATAAAAYLNNNDNVFLVEDMRGAFRVVGSEKWPTKTTVTQDLGQGVTGTTSTTINVEATDECPAPFYAGRIVVDEGTINEDGNSSQSSGGSSSGGGSSVPVYDSGVYLNGLYYNIAKGSKLTIAGNLSTMKFTGKDMTSITYEYQGELESDIDVEYPAGTVATWKGSITAPKTITIRRTEGQGDNKQVVVWFTIELVTSSSSNDEDESWGD